MKKRLGCLVLLGSPFLVLLLVLLFFLSANDSDCETPLSDSVATSSLVASNTDWTKEGTVAYKNAKMVFDSWVSRGLSGAAAAGIVGWVNSEGGFSLVDRAEGYYGTDITTNGLSAGVIPKGGSGYAVGGGGIYQFTPYTKFAEAGDHKWLDVDAQNRFVAQAILSGDWNASMDLTGGHHTFQQMAQMTDPKQATLVWQAYERGNVAHINQAQKQADAQKAYEMFGGAGHDYDDLAFSKGFGGTPSKANQSTFSQLAAELPSCSSKTGGDWATDGGMVFYRSQNAWKKDDLPADLKRYALDPLSLGLSFRESKGWQAIAYSGGQCTDLSASLMYALWEKDGTHPKMTSGNGEAIARNWSKAMGETTTRMPTAGAVFSQTPASAGNAYGHTGLVSHVFSNGDVLVIEQNYSSLSGEGGGFGKYTWSYRYVSVQDYRNGWTFYDLSQAGYHMVANVSSVA